MPRGRGNELLGSVPCDKALRKFKGYGTSSPTSPPPVEHGFHEAEWTQSGTSSEQSAAFPCAGSILKKAGAGLGALMFFTAAVISAAVNYRASPLAGKDPLPKLWSRTSVAAAPGVLNVTASNIYGDFDEATLGLYGLDMVIEPFRETTLTVGGVGSPPKMDLDRYVWRLRHGSNYGITYGSLDDAWSYTGGPQATLTVDRPGTTYVLTVQRVNEDDEVIAERRLKVSCKYVRREIRDLTDEDREAFLDAMQIWYTIPTDVGKTKYGPDFSNYQVITATHNTHMNNFCYHQGMQFLTSHAAFDLIVERYLQMIDPRVSLPFWDYMIEAASLGSEWYNSVMFDPDWFGSAMGEAQNDFMVTGGRFGNVSSIYDPEHTLVDSRLHPSYNSYGYVSSTYNYQDLSRLTRTSSYCGLASSATFATTDVFVGCFDQSSSFYEWERCMQYKIHGDIHGLLGGAFNCNMDMALFAEEHPEYSHGLLSFTLQYLTFKYWPRNWVTPDDNVCDMSCTRGQTEPCGCTCLIDAFTVSDEQVYGYMEDFMSTAITDFTGDEFIAYDEEAPFPYGFVQDDERMSDEEALFLMRVLVKIGCEPGAVGMMSTAASPLDPIFWVLHPMFEKGVHMLLLSPKYQWFDMEWVDTGVCPGCSYTDELPFTESILGLGSGTDFITNERLLGLMNPSNPALPYVYTDCARWGNTDTDLI